MDWGWFILFSACQKGLSLKPTERSGPVGKLTKRISSQRQVSEPFSVVTVPLQERDSLQVLHADGSLHFRSTAWSLAREHHPFPRSGQLFKSHNPGGRQCMLYYKVYFFQRFQFDSLWTHCPSSLCCHWPGRGSFLKAEEEPPPPPGLPSSAPTLPCQKFCPALPGGVCLGHLMVILKGGDCLRSLGHTPTAPSTGLALQQPPVITKASQRQHQPACHVLTHPQLQSVVYLQVLGNE